MSNHARHVRLLGAAGVVLLIAAVAAIVVGLRGPHHAPQPPAAAASPVDVTPTTPTTTLPVTTRPGTGRTSAPTRGPLLARSFPTRLDVPAIGVHTALKRIGLNSSNMIKTPPLGGDSHAYWLNVSPTPGQLGPATIIGHVDSAANGPAVFFRLGALRQRDTISVTRADATVAVFQVERVVQYPKATFPTQAVYGNLDHAGLRLITCGGIFDAARHSYESNIVVFASLISSRKA